MIAVLRKVYDRFRGGGDYALSVPSLDGAYRPNSDLDAARVVAELRDPDNLIAVGGVLHLSSGPALLRITGGVVETLRDFGQPITALAASPGGEIAVALAGGAVLRMTPAGAETRLPPVEQGSDVTALAFLADGGLAIALGARGRTAAEWQHDVMTHGRSGSVWIADRAGQTRRIASDLAWPCGLTEAAEGGLIVACAWDHALIRLDLHGRRSDFVTNLPGYPARITPAAGGGYWLALFAPRNQLVEFVLREDPFRRRMMAEIDPEFWVCPALRQPRSPLAPMQEGAERIHGEMKPWAPTLSYGMIVRVSAEGLPQHSLHSRANGMRHGITSLTEMSGRLYASSYGADAILEITTE